MNNNSQFAEALDDCAVDAALYVLGTLPPEKAGAVEQRLRSGCPYCAAQAEHYAAVAEHLSLAAAPVEPRPELRKRLLDRIKPFDAPPQAFEQRKIVRGNDGPWVKMPVPGVEMRSLIADKTFLVRMRAGTVFPKHDHAQAEQCFVLEGTITDSDGTTLRAGDFVVMSSGTQHDPIHTDSGCTLFIAYAD
jgi:anti-sigma factor RsiW